MSNVITFPAGPRINYVKEALQSIAHFYNVGEDKSCSILHGARTVTVRTPKGMWVLTDNEWNKEEFNRFK